MNEKKKLKLRKLVLRGLKAKAVELYRKMRGAVARDRLDPRPWEAHTPPRDPREFSQYGPNPRVPAIGERPSGPAVISQHPHGSEAWARDMVAPIIEANLHGAPYVRGRDVLQQERGSFLFPNGRPRNWMDTDAYRRLYGGGGSDQGPIRY
jgi:hypothetical protein